MLQPDRRPQLFVDAHASDHGRVQLRRRVFLRESTGFGLQYRLHSSRHVELLVSLVILALA